MDVTRPIMWKLARRILTIYHPNYVYLLCMDENYVFISGIDAFNMPVN